MAPTRHPTPDGARRAGFGTRRGRAGAAVALVLRIALVLFAAAPPARAATWSIEARLGAPVVPDRRLVVTQSGHPDLDFTARFGAATGETPYHYDLRVVRREGAGGWALGFLHAKLILANGPPEVQDLQMTHGYNLLTAQRLWERRGLDLMAGAGVALAHAESTVRGQAFAQDGGLLGAGYHAVAPVLTAGIGRREALGRGTYLSGEGRLSWSRAVVPVAGGHARFTDVEWHFLAGFGASF